MFTNDQRKPRAVRSHGTLGAVQCTLVCSGHQTVGRVRVGTWRGDIFALNKCGSKFQVPIAGQGSQCRPVGLSRYVGPSAIPRKFQVW